jgi:hypothetical protein
MAMHALLIASESKVYLQDFNPLALQTVITKFGNLSFKIVHG